MGSTQSLERGHTVQDTGAPIQVPVGQESLGRIMNAVGEPIDEQGPIKAQKFSSIYRPAPDFLTTANQLVTGIKAIDLLFPCMKGHKIGLIGETATGQTTLIS